MTKYRLLTVAVFLLLGVCLNAAITLLAAWLYPEHRWIASFWEETPSGGSPFQDHPLWTIEVRATATSTRIVRGAHLRGGDEAITLADLPYWSNARNAPHGAAQRFAETAYGWPFRSLMYEYEMNHLLVGFSGNLYYLKHVQSGLVLTEIENLPHPNDWRDTIRILPCGVIWPGTIINCILFGSTVWVVFRFLPRTVVRRIRQRRHRCVHCGYPVGASEVCTECGTRIQQ